MEKAYDRAREALITAVEEGQAYRLLPHDNAGRTSEYAAAVLTSAGSDATALLFAAAHAACGSALSRPLADAAAAELLRRFVSRAAAEYADANEGVW